jgi:hypothetical protein
MDISESQGKNGFRTFSFSLGAGICAFKGQQVEVRPTGWEDDVCDSLQGRQRGCAPFMPIFLLGGMSCIDPYGERIAPHKNACLQNVLMESFICRKSATRLFKVWTIPS